MGGDTLASVGEPYPVRRAANSVAGFAGNRAEVKSLFPGCAEDRHTLMPLGNLSSHGSTTGCTEYNQDDIDYIMPGHQEYCAAAGYTPHPY